QPGDDGAGQEVRLELFGDAVAAARHGCLRRSGASRAVRSQAELGNEEETGRIHSQISEARMQMRPAFLTHFSASLRQLPHQRALRASTRKVACKTSSARWAS